MRYAMTWTNRLGGSGKENEEGVRRALELFSKWQPPDGTTFHQFVGRVDGEGGFAIVGDRRCNTAAHRDVEVRSVQRLPDSSSRRYERMGASGTRRH
jgi:hypothetical protein